MSTTYKCECSSSRCPGYPKCKCQDCIAYKAKQKTAAANNNHAVADVPKIEQEAARQNQTRLTKHGLNSDVLAYDDSEIGILAEDTSHMNDSASENNSNSGIDDIAAIKDLSQFSPINMSGLDWIDSPQGNGAVGKFGFVTRNKLRYMAKPEDEISQKERDAENEYLCNTIGQIIGLNIPTFGKAPINGFNAFFQKWFTVEGMQLKHIWRFFNEGDERASIEEVDEAIRKNSSKPEEDSRIWARIVLFDCIIGNSDRHGRNLGLTSHNKKSRLSPVYDNTSRILPDATLGLQCNFSNFFKTINSESPTVKDCISEIKRLWPNYYKELFSLILSKKEDILAAISNSDLRQDQKAALEKQSELVFGGLNDE